MKKAGKTITITPDLEDAIVTFCDDELNYHINESACPEEYTDEIEAQISLLTLLGHHEMAEAYSAQFRLALKDI